MSTRVPGDREWHEGVRAEMRDAARENAREMERRAVEGHATGSRAPDPDEIASVEKNLRDEVRRRLSDATPERAATWSWRFVAVAYVPILGFALLGVAVLGHADDFWTRLMVCLGCAGLGSVYGVGIHDLWGRLRRD